jgi:hypothetical protein
MFSGDRRWWTGICFGSRDQPEGPWGFLAERGGCERQGCRVGIAHRNGMNRRGSEFCFAEAPRRGVVVSLIVSNGARPYSGGAHKVREAFL